MAEHEQTKRQRSEELEESGHKKKRQEANYDQLKAPDEGIADLLKESSLDGHAALLANTNSDSQRASLVTHLQRSYGNNYVQRLLSSRIVQAKLTVNPPDDEYEREADRVADTVTLGMPSQVQRQEEEEEEEVQAKSSQVQRQEEEEEEEVQAKSSQVQRQEEEEEEEIQPKAAGSQPLTVSENLEEQINTARGSGQPLNESVRASLEPQFKSDFSQVRIHTDAEADKLSQQLGARAFTTGGDIFFRSGEYDPETPSGQKLLAHELTHTQQQGASKRIAGWWPKGHKLITEKAMETVKDDYSTTAKNFIISHTPNLDMKGKALKGFVGGKIKSAFAKRKYKKLIKSGAKEDAQNMYNDNELHVRDTEYQDEHGEGGHYKQAGTSVNEGKTRTMTSLAYIKWLEGNKMDALSKLADTLHQAEDRGSHGEGNPFTGHDVRLGLFQQEWEKPNYKPGKLKPDDIGENSEGATLAVGHAEKVLKEFRDKVGKVGLEKGQQIHAVSGPKSALSWLFRGPLNIKRLFHMKGSTGLGSTKGKAKLEVIIENELKKPDVKAAYEKAGMSKKEIIERILNRPLPPRP